MDHALVSLTPPLWLAAWWRRTTRPSQFISLSLPPLTRSSIQRTDRKRETRKRECRPRERKECRASASPRSSRTSTSQTPSPRVARPPPSPTTTCTSGGPRSASFRPPMPVCQPQLTPARAAHRGTARLAVSRWRIQPAHLDPCRLSLQATKGQSGRSAVIENQPSPQATRAETGHVRDKDLPRQHQRPRRNLPRHCESSHAGGACVNSRNKSILKPTDVHSSRTSGLRPSRSSRFSSRSRPSSPTRTRTTP
jgi:hypothetical protein